MAWYTSHGMRPAAPGMRDRDPLDHYPTPAALVESALALVESGGVDRVLDPGCGAGAWGIGARARWPGAWISGVDLDHWRLGLAAQSGAYSDLVLGDFLHQAAPVGGAFDLVVGNPPYKHAESFVLRSLDLVRPGGAVVFLLRLAWLESRGRFDRLFSGPARPWRVLTLVGRPSFTGNGRSDSTAYAVFQWVRGWRGVTVLDWLSWS